MVKARRRRQSPKGQPAAEPATRDRILLAAAEEFSARGFDGAKVDRIAARARVNKALLYYYFRSKSGLYREILLDLFRTVATAVSLVRDAGGAPEAQLEAFVQAVADETVKRPLFPTTWLREMAEGGRHVDEPIVLEMRRVIETLGAILHEGREAGVFREANPFVVQISIVAPLLFFTATAPVRERFRHMVPGKLTAIPRDQVVQYVRTATLGALRADVRGSARVSSRREPS